MDAASRRLPAVRFEARKRGGSRGCGKRSRAVDEVRLLRGRDIGYWILDVGRRRLPRLVARLFVPGFLESLEFPLCSGEGALQAGLRLPEPVQQRDLVFGAELLYQETYLAYLHAPQFPLRDRHLLDIELFGASLRLPFGLQ